jgi:Ca2+-binding RTX toxin-like protein
MQMLLSKFWKNRRQLRSEQSKRRARSFNPPVQVLEDRVYLSASTLFANGELSIVIEEGNDSVAVGTNPINTLQVQVLVNGVPDTSLPFLLASQVGRLTVIGSDTENLIDLTGVTSAAFTFVEPRTGNPLQIDVDGDNGDDTIIASDGFDATLNGGNGDDVITVSTGLGNLTISGQDGNDTIFGGFGNDTITAGDGDDSVDAGGGDDSVNAGNGGDSVLGNTGNDTVLAGNGTDTIDGGVGDDSLMGEDGTDSLLGNDGDDTLHGGLRDDTLDGGFGDDSIDGAAAQDSIIGNFGNDTLTGGSGRDTIDGAAGDDVLNGMSGNDSLIGGPHDDIVYGGSGVDVITGDAGQDTLRGNSGNDSLDGGKGFDNLDGGAGDDVTVAGGDPVNRPPELSIDNIVVQETGTFIRTFNTTAGLTANVQFIATADFDRDGNTDFVVTDGATAATPADNVGIRFGNGAGGFGAFTLLTAGDGAGVVVTGDFNGDNAPDIAVANRNSNNVTVFLNDGTGMAFPTPVVVGVGMVPVDLKAGDIDGDGDLDLATANQGDDTVSILTNDGAGAFAGANFPSFGLSPEGVAIGDFTGDGRGDIAVVHSGSQDLIVLPDEAPPSMTPYDMPVATALLPGSSGGRLVSGDMDGDGDIDLGVAGNDYQVALNDGTGAFVLTATGFGAVDSVATDLDLDGDLDLALVDGNTNNVQFLENNGMGVFGTGAIIGTNFFGDDGTDIAVGDIDSDGLPDLLLTGQDPFPFSMFSNGSVSTLLNDTQPTVDVIFTVTLTGDHRTDVTVDYALVDGTATILSDDVLDATGTLTFPIGTRVQQVVVTVLRDFLAEGTETFDLVLSNVFGATIADDTGTATILDNDSLTDEASFQVVDSMIDPEGSAESSTLTFTVNLLNPAAIGFAAVTVDYTTVDVTAADQEDYVGVSGTLLFAPGQSFQTVDVVVPHDTTPEATEYFALVLSNPTLGVLLGDDRGLATIVDDDGPLPVGLTGDTLVGNTGNDTLTGGRFEDVINGMSGNDVIEGGEGRDTLYGGAGTDTIRGGIGDDSLFGQGGADVLEGGPGNDIIVWRGEQDGDDIFTFEDGFDTVQINGNSSNNDFVVSQDGSTLVVTEGSSSIRIFGDDVGFAAGSEIIQINGGRGNDTITIEDINNVGFFVLQVDGDVGRDTVTGLGAQVGIGPIRIDGGMGNDTLTGTTGDDSILGGVGLDTIDGREGDDTLSGGSGDDIIEGLTGDDTIRGDDGNDTVTAGAGDDLMEGGFGNDSLTGGDGNDTAMGSFGSDVLNGMAGDDSLLGMLGRDTLLGGSGNDTLDGGRDDDNLNGQSGDDILRADHGDDILRGGGGDDTLDAGDGADLVWGQSGADAIFGGDGDDTINGDSGADTIDGHDGDDLINGGSMNDIMVGGDGDDTINGNSGSDTAGGNLGDDVIGSSEFVNDMLVLSDADRAKLNATT